MTINVILGQVLIQGMNFKIINCRRKWYKNNFYGSDTGGDVDTGEIINVQR